MRKSEKQNDWKKSSAKGDRLWYEYDFGDGWRHVLRVEKVLHSPPSTPVCLTGRLACPPEDCGGVWGYSELAAWVRSDYDDDLRPDVFDSTEEALAWLPNGWHPNMPCVPGFQTERESNSPNGD